MATATPTPATTAIASPSSTSLSVTQALSISSDQSSLNARDRLGGRGQRQVVHRVERRHALPERQERGEQQPGQSEAGERPHAPTSSTSRARRTSATKAGSASASLRLAGPRQADLELRDHAARPRRQHRHAVGEQDRLLHVVGHQQHRARLGGERVRQPLLHRCPRDRVERPERLVEEQHRAAGEERAQERHALAHPAGQLGRAGALELGEPEALEQRLRTLARGRLGGPLAFERQRGVPERVAPGQQEVALGHVGGRREPLRAPLAPITVRAPASGSCRPATSSSSVDLPQPDGPTTATTSPARTSRSRLSSATTGERRPKRRATPLSEIPVL